MKLSLSDVEELFDDKSEEENSDNEKQEKVGAEPQLMFLQYFSGDETKFVWCREDNGCTRGSDGWFLSK